MKNYFLIITQIKQTRLSKSKVTPLSLKVVVYILIIRGILIVLVSRDKVCTLISHKQKNYIKFPKPETRLMRSNHKIVRNPIEI